MAEKRDYYEVLGVAKNANAESDRANFLSHELPP